MEDMIKARDAYLDKRSELGNLLLYPPFAFLPKDELSDKKDEYMWPAKTKLGRDFENKFDEEIDRVEGLARKEKSTELYARPFAKIEAEFQDHLDEARLWMKRYPNDRDTAMIEAQKIHPVNEKIEII